MHGIVQSVTFAIDNAETITETFFRGNAFVTNKDKVTQPSSALRHSTEFTHLIHTNFNEDGITSKQPVAVVVSNGGPDHKVTFGSVQVTTLAMFLVLDFDMVVYIRPNVPLSVLAKRCRKSDVYP